MRLLRWTITAGAMLAVTGTAFAVPNAMHRMHNAMSSKVLNINMGAQNGSKQNGTASIKDVAGGVWVKVSVFNEPKGGSEPAHIHQGTCKKLNPAPYKPLSNVVNGTSTTTVKGITVASLKKAHYAINVHQSAANLKKYVSCGDI
ncbi:MAG: hypothetical protein JO193_07905 [Candidatus Eremiobacteraeota bacterium]|nr:hypothetical protein [Candidatus Eremiobacteraeota bacterium]MBV9972596.1 hypothetical protein [Candidatus Eremiobacteraeota bacterium]